MVLETISKAFQGIKGAVGAIREIYKAQKQFREGNHESALDAFLLFLDNMVRLLELLGVQRQDRTSPAGLRILQEIETECVKVKDTLDQFQRKSKQSKAVTTNFGSIVEDLRSSRVNLSEDWTLYLVSVCAAGSSGGQTNPIQVALPLGAAGCADPELVERVKVFSCAVATVSDAHSGAEAAQQQLNKLAQLPTAAGSMSDEQEQRLATVLAAVQRALLLPSTSTGVATSVVQKLEEMQQAMGRSIAHGRAELQQQLARLAVQHSETQAMLAEMRGTLALQQVAIGGLADLPTAVLDQVRQFFEAVKAEEPWVLDQTIMACPGISVPFAAEGDAQPTLMPGCSCTVSRVAAEVYLEKERCGVCNQYVARVQPDGSARELLPDKTALQILDDYEKNRLPVIPKFDIGSDFVVGKMGQEGTRYGGEGVVRFGMLRGKPAAVKTVEFAQPGTSQRQWRGRRHVLLNSVWTQHRAAQASTYVCDIIGVCWEDNCAHLAMPLYKKTLEMHVEESAKHGMPVHLVLELCCALTRAVYSVHKCGILHCDINPANVLMADDGSPRLTDFGLSRVERGTLKTRTSMGHTMLYAAPEQAAVNGRVNVATDIYALGRTLAFAATGIKPSHEGQKMPQEPAELKVLLEMMTADKDTRRQIKLLGVLTEFELLLTKYGPIPMHRVQCIDTLSERLAFGDDVNLVGREIDLSKCKPTATGRAALRPVPPGDDSSIHAWTFCTESDATCWDLAQHGAILCNATFRIPARGRLYVLADKAAGTWRNVKVTGGEDSAVVVHGAMTLDNVTFEGCTLTATTSASVSAAKCTFTATRLAVCAAGAKFDLDGCTVTECQFGIAVAGRGISGASITVTNKSSIQCIDGCCISAQGSEASVVVTQGCTMSVFSDTAAGRNWAIAAQDGSTVRLQGATMSGAGRSDSPSVGALLVHGKGTKATLVDCEIQVPYAAVLVEAAGIAELEGCRANGGRRGMKLSGAGSRLTLADCTVTACRGAIQADDGTSVTVTSKSSLQCIDGYCIYAQGSGASVTVSQGCALSLISKTIPCPNHWAVVARAGSTVSVEGATISGAGGTDSPVAGALFVHGEGTNATLVNCVIRVSDIAVSVGAAGAADIQGCTAEGGRRGMMAIGAGSRLTLAGCRVTDCNWGITVHDGASVTVNSTSSIQCIDGSCITTRGPGACMVVTRGCTLSVSSNTTEGSNQWAVAALDGSTVSVEGATMSGAGGSDSPSIGALLVHGEGTKATLVDCEIQVPDGAVLVEEEGVADFQGCTAEGGRRGLVVTGAGSRVTASGCTIAGCVLHCAAAECAGALELVECTLRDSMKGSGVNVHGNGSSASLTHCAATKNSHAGVNVQEGAWVKATRCMTSGNGSAGAAVDCDSILVMFRCKSEEKVAVKKPWWLPKCCLVRADCTPR